MKRRNIHIKGVFFLLCSFILLLTAYHFSELKIDIVSYQIGNSPRIFGSLTGLGILLTLSAGFLLGFVFYLVELIQLKTKYRVIREIRKRRRHDL